MLTALLNLLTACLPPSRGLAAHDFLLAVIPILSTYLMQELTSIFIFSSLSYCMAKTWTVNTDLKRQIDVFGNKCLSSSMVYRWNDFVSNQRLLSETESRHITSLVHQHQLRLYGHVARYPQADPQVISERDNLWWMRPSSPQSSWLEQVNSSCWELLGMGMGLAWRLAQGDRQS